MAREGSKMTSALQSLTATYTDSEGEADSYSDGEQVEAVEIVGSTKGSSRESTPNSLAQKEPKGTSMLVSYVPDAEEEFVKADSDMDEGSDDDSDRLSSDSKWSIEMDQQPDSPISFHRKLLTKPSTEPISLPAEPAGRCSNSLQEKISKLYAKKVKDKADMTATIQKRKDFRNPSIYEKLIQFCNLDEFGTNYPPEIYDPHYLGEESYYDELAKRQKEEMDKREKEKKERTKVEFMSGTAKKIDIAAIVAEAQKRKSKWDVSASQSGLGAMTALKPSGIVTNPPTIVPVTTSSGTKGTQIPAFGSIAKKSSK